MRKVFIILALSLVTTPISGGLYFLGICMEDREVSSLSSLIFLIQMGMGCIFFLALLLPLVSRKNRQG